MDNVMNEKVRPEHRKRNAYLYVRQSTLRQVAENMESTKRQYGLKDRAVALGWDPSQIITIDNDLGQSGTSSVTRPGFQRLVAEVSLGKAGIVIGLEVSRLARNSSDWHRLIELCGLMETLILDEDGIYDPGQFNDRLVLGIKGTLSEAEIHVLRSRMRGGLLNKARRGELVIPLPVGFLYDGGQVILDPDQQVQQSVRQLFATYRRTGSAGATVRHFQQQGWNFPTRSATGPRPGDLLWVPLTVNRVNSAVRNPCYAGAYAFGQFRHRRKPDGTEHVFRAAREQWYKLDQQAHAGYLSWEEYEQNLLRMKANAARLGAGAPREGPALLQGLAYCGRCGAAMSVRYHRRPAGLIPDYVCSSRTSNRGQPLCQSIGGMAVDRVAGKAILDSITPARLELAMSVQAEIDARHQECDQLFRAQVERARYEASVAERRYKSVDASNRLVAATLESDWNEKLTRLGSIEREYENKRSARVEVSADVRERILQLAQDIPRLWNDPSTAGRDRKRIARILLHDVTVTRDSARILLHLRFKGGATETIQVFSAPETDPKAIALIRQLLDQNTRHADIAAALNAQGFRTARGRAFDSLSINSIAHRIAKRRSDTQSPDPSQDRAGAV